MTRLRQRMIEDMQLRGLSGRTQDIYIRAVKQLAKHYEKSPDQVTDQQSSLLSLDQVVRCPSCGQTMKRKQIIRPKERCPPLAKMLFQTITPTLFTEALL